MSPIHGRLHLRNVHHVLSAFAVPHLLPVHAGGFLRSQIGSRRGSSRSYFPPLLTPTLINETKGTLVFVPIGLIVTFLAAADPRRRIRALLTAVA